MRIGVDVGGTNTDAVLVEGSKVVASIKMPTTPDVSSGIVLAVRDILGNSGVRPASIQATMIGTTQFTNAFVERKRLVEVAVIRIALPANSSLRPLVDWPRDLLAVVGENTYMVHGGYEFDGSEITPLDEVEILETARDIKRKGIAHVAISCVFSPINDQMERRAAALVREVIPGANITLSSEIGRLSLIERENATVMNAALANLSKRVVGSFRNALESLQIAAPFFISQNDGTLMSADYVEKYPVLTFASGPTNSMRGAALLSGLGNAIVADIGGTTTDVGVLTQRFPRESSVAVDIGGVRTNFRMPDILSVGLGGGSVVRQSGGKVTVGPDSVGYELTQRALVFGGDEITATDIAVAAGHARIGDAGRVSQLKPAFVESAVLEIHRQVEDAIDRMKTSAEPAPVVLVGGGGILIKRSLKGASQVVIPELSGVANAMGAAMAQVSGESDRLFSYDTVGRDRALADAKAEATEKAIAAGARKDTLSIVEVEEVPIAYMPGGAVRVRVKAIGDLNLGELG